MSSEFDPLLWFVCKICRQAFPDTDKLKKHQIRKHPEHCKNVKCIVFEERFFGKQWIPSDNYFPESNSKFTNENVIEVPPLTFNCGCHCHSIAAVSAETQTDSHREPPNHEPNPFVLVKRLTSTELNTALSRSAEKSILQSSCSSEARKRTSRRLNNEDVQSPKYTKEYFNHQENPQDPDQDLLAVQNILVSPTELLQNLVTQTGEPNTCVLPEPVGFSSADPLSANSCTPPSCLKGIENVHNSEKNRLQEAISFTLLEGNIHVELLSVTKQIESSTEQPDLGNQLLPKTKIHKRSPLSAEEQNRIGAKNLSKPSQSPYVLIQRLTFGGLDTAITHNSEEMTIKSIPRCKGRKRIRDDNDLSPPKNKRYLQHQNQEQDDPAEENHSVCNSELFQEMVAPKAEPSRDAFPEDGKFSSNISLSDPSVNAPSDIKYVGSMQNMEENDEQLPTEAQTLECQEQNIEGVRSSANKKIWCSRSDPNSSGTTILAQPSLLDFGRSNKTEVEDDNENLSETDNAEQIPIISDIYSQASVIEDICPSDSDCFEMENPVSPELSDKFVLVEERHSPTPVVSGGGVGFFEGEQHSNVELNENIIYASSSACPILFSSDIDTVSPKPELSNTSELEQPRYSTRASRKKPQINYSESHICSECNLDFDSFDDLQDHQRMCRKQNRVDSVNNRDKKSRQVYQILSSTDPNKVKKSPSTVTDCDSDYAATGGEDASESESDHCIKPVGVPRAKSSKTKTLTRFSPATVSQYHQQSQLINTAEERNLALLKWLDTQKEVLFADGSTNKIIFSACKFSTAQRFGPGNFIKCELCQLKLKTESHLINHVKNCWLHNQRNHCYCVACDKRFASPQVLANHFQEKKYRLKHSKFRRENGPHKLESNENDVDLDEGDDYQMQCSVNESDPHATAPGFSDKDLPLLQWLKLQHQNPDNVVALELNPSKLESKSTPTTFSVSKSSPIKCKLCLQLLTSDLLLRNHVETCWSQNKGKHRYCVPCKKYFKSSFILKGHQQNLHKNLISQKQKQKSSWFCIACLKNMENESDFNAHQESLQIFLGKSSQTESIDFLSKEMPPAVSTQGQCINIPGQELIAKNLSEWLKHIRNVPNSDGTANLVLIDPEPGSPGHLAKGSEEIEINEDNPITCRLCLKKLTQVEDVKNHVQMCWSQNKENHRYCLSCDKGFATPTELQQHKTSEHSAPKNIVLFYREADGDGSSLNMDGLEVNSDNPVTCKLCETQLVSTPEVKIHSENCWFHNKSCHVYCTICERSLYDSKRLKSHNHNQHRNSRSCGSVKDQSEREIVTETEKLLSLQQWLKIQKEDLNNVIALEPDPSISETVSESSPVKCKLCQQLFTTDVALRKHVKTCWKYNKTKHCYCIPCNQNFVPNKNLRLHNKSKHPKYPTILFTCRTCNQEFLIKSELTKHTESLQEFCRQKINYKNPVTKVHSVKTDKCSNTMAFLFEWVKRLRRNKNLDGSENIILVDPEPTADNFEEINSENPITCRLCQQKFNNAFGLHRHVRLCWTQKKEIHRFCVVCEKVFETPQDLQDHSRVEHLDVVRASFKCKFCSQEFVDEKIYQTHQDAHKDPNFLPFNCLECSVSFKDKGVLLKHVTASHRKRQNVGGYKCKICPKSFNAQVTLNDHIRCAHTGERPFKCEFPNCNYVTHAKRTRRIHYNLMHAKELGLEPQQFLCPTCGKVFGKRLGLTRHLKISHTLEKPYKCTHQDCTKAFKTSIQLTEHVRDHTGEKPYVCEECGQAFARLWSFSKHKRSHAGTLNRAQCHLCPRKFLGGWELKQHLKIHQERKEFKCQFCEVQCTTRAHLKKHEKTHENEPDSSSEDDSKSSSDSNV